MKGKISIFGFGLFLIFLSAIFFAFFYNFFQAPVSLASASDNVWGYAWSENIGWIKFNNCEDPTNPGTCVGNGFGVHIDPVTGNLSGYAWSNNIGWLSFNDFDGAHPQAQLDFVTDQISGWARFLSHGDNWDGWVKLRDATYGVSRNDCNIEGFAWGDLVVGWIGFTNVKTTERKDDFSISISPDRDITAGEETTYDITVTSIGEFEGDVNIYASIYDSSADEQNDYNNHYNWSCEGELCKCNKADVNRDGTVDDLDKDFISNSPNYNSGQTCETAYPNENSIERYNCNRADVKRDGEVNILDIVFHGIYADLTCSQLKDITLDFSPSPVVTVNVPQGGSSIPKALTVYSSVTTPAGTLYVRATGVYITEELDNGPERTASAELSVTAPPNNPPSASNLSVEEGNYCTATAPPVFLSWVFTDPDTGDTQSAYQVQVDNNADFSSPEVDSCDPAPGTCASGNTSKTYPPPNLSYNTTYYWRLMVWDDKGAESGWIDGPSFTTGREPPDPSFECSLGPSFDWTSDCNSLGAITNETVHFRNTNAGYDYYGWDFDYDGSFDPDLSNQRQVGWTFTGAREYVVRHRVTDYQGTADEITCDGSQTINIYGQLPEWREIAPIAWLKKFLASILSFF